MTGRLVSLAGIALAASVGMIGLAVLALRVPFVWDPAAERAAVETAATLVALLTAYLFAGRYRRTRRLDQLVIALSLATLALSNLLIVAIVAWAPGARPGWNLVIGSDFAAALLFATAAFVPIARPHRPVLAALLLAGGAVAVLAAADAIVHGLSVGLPGAVPQPAYSDHGAHVERHASVFSVQLVAGAAFAVAAVGLGRRSRRTGDEAMAWLVVAALFAASARLSYLLMPPWDADWVHTGDIFRFLFYAALLVAALREILSYWRRLADGAVLAERRRLAHTLHLQVADELAFIDRRARLLASEVDPVLGRQIVGATERAVRASERTMAVLTRGIDEPLDDVLVGAPLQSSRLASLHPEEGPRRNGAGDDGQGADLRLAHVDSADAADARHAVTNGGRRGALPFAPARVLVADDHLRSRVAVHELLEDDRRFVVCASVTDAAEAVQAALRERPDLCLVSVGIPGGGAAATREITARLPATRVVMLAESAGDEDLFAALRAGASGFLLRDIDPERLGHALSDVLAGEVAIPRALVARLVQEFREQAPRRRALLDGSSEPLTSREWQVMDLLRQERTTAEIARRLVISEVTVRTHVASILKKLGVSNRRAAIELFRAELR